MIPTRKICRHLAPFLTWCLVAVSFICLAIEPARWLLETWADPAFDSAGGHFLAVAAGLAIWSASSPRETEAPSRTSLWWCLPAAAGLRLAGHLLVIPALGALVLPVGAYALGRLGDLSHRRRAVSPFWLAGLVGLTVPFEHFVKRLAGYGLQHVAADGTCSLLRLVYSDVTCNGLDIALQGRNIFVALPCSGVRGLILYSILFTGLAALVRPSIRQAILGFGAAVTAAIVVNCLRISLLAVGLAHEASLGIDVMQQPWHMSVGLACLPLGFAQVALWARWVAQSPSKQNEPPHTGYAAKHPWLRLAAAVTFFAVTLALPFTPRHPLDVSDTNAELELPARLADFSAQSRDLHPVERKHFTRFGGEALEASYGPHTLLVVETSAPLRHLHAPDEWLGDLDYSVESSGRADGILPAARYLVEAPGGRRWILDVTFVSEQGRLATSVSEAIWYWLSSPTTTWRVLYRFHPDGLSRDHVARFDRSVAEHSRFIAPWRTSGAGF
jgi:exosortase/archaeosortase family protein